MRHEITPRKRTRADECSALLGPGANVNYSGGVQPGGSNMAQLMKQAQKMQQQLVAAQEALAAAEVTGTAGGGLVTAVMSGTGELRAIAIDPSVLDPDDAETVQDLVVAAVHDAARAVADLSAEKMGPLSQGLNLPGLDLPGL
jgi:nucleoid-associated protein EbfC